MRGSHGDASSVQPAAKPNGRGVPRLRVWLGCLLVSSCMLGSPTTSSETSKSSQPPILFPIDRATQPYHMQSASAQAVLKRSLSSVSDSAVRPTSSRPSGHSVLPTTCRARFDGPYYELFHIQSTFIITGIWEPSDRHLEVLGTCQFAKHVLAMSPLLTQWQRVPPA
jgi:hypothetical protein